MPLKCGNVEIRGVEPLTSCMPSRCRAVYAGRWCRSLPCGGADRIDDGRPGRCTLLLHQPLNSDARRLRYARSPFFRSARCLNSRGGRSPIESSDRQRPHPGAVPSQVGVQRQALPGSGQARKPQRSEGRPGTSESTARPGRGIRPGRTAHPGAPDRRTPPGQGRLQTSFHAAGPRASPRLPAGSRRSRHPRHTVCMPAGTPGASAENPCGRGTIPAGRHRNTPRAPALRSHCRRYVHRGPAPASRAIHRQRSL